MLPYMPVGGDLARHTFLQWLLIAKRGQKHHVATATCPCDSH